MQTADQLAKSVVAAGLASADEIKTYWASLPADQRPRDATAFARLLVARGTLSEFQSQELLSGSQTPLVLGDYVLLGKIGAGGMGQVFKAQHRHMERLVAIKLLPPALTQDEAAIQRFQREVKAAAKLSHPNIVHALDAGFQRGVWYLVMEFVEGSDLSSVVAKNGPLPLDRLLDYLGQAARGLAFAHSKGVIHRDIKPANMLLSSEGVVKILDMGLARFDDAGKHDGLTQSGQVMGTIDYMAPEQAFDTQKVDARADLYSLGCTLYRLATGRNLYDGETMVQKLMAHQSKPIPSLVAARADLPTALDSIFQKLVAKQPQDRYQTAAEVEAALAALAAPPSSGRSETTRQDEDSKLTSFIHSLGGGKRVPPAIAPAPAVGVAAPAPPTSDLAATVNLKGPLAGTDPVSDRSIRIAREATPNPAVRPPKKGPPRALWLAAGCGGLLLLLLGVWVIVRDKDGKEVARIPVPPGGKVEVETAPAEAPTPPGESPGTAPPATASDLAQREREVAAWVISTGGTATFADGVKSTEIKAAAELAGVQGNLVRVSLVDRKLTLEDVARLDGLGSSRPRFEFGSQRVTFTRGALAALLNQGTVTEVGGEYLKLEPGALEGLTTNYRLETIYLVNGEISPDFLASLGPCQRLKKMRLYGVKGADDAVMAALAANPPPKLEILEDLPPTVGPAALPQLAKLPHLGEVRLNSPLIDDTAVRSLAGAPALYTIWGLPKATRTGRDWLHTNLQQVLVRNYDPAQAPQLHDASYYSAAEKLLQRGFKLHFYGGDGNQQNNPWLEANTKLPPRDTNDFSVGAARYPAQVDAADWQELAKLRDLMRLTAYDTRSPPLTPEALQSLKPLQNLMELDLGNQLAADASVQLLPQFPKLRVVKLAAPSDQAVATIATLPHLSVLWLHKASKLTDAALVPLEKAVVLNDLWLGDPISRAAAQRFADQRPDVLVRWNNEFLVSARWSPAPPPAASAAPKSASLGAPLGFKSLEEARAYERDVAAWVIECRGSARFWNDENGSWKVVAKTNELATVPGRLEGVTVGHDGPSHQLTRADAARLARLPGIRGITLRNCTIDPGVENDLVAIQSPYTAEIAFLWCKFATGAFANLRPNPRLQAISVGMGDVPRELLTQLARFPRLQSLSFYGSKSFDDAALQLLCTHPPPKLTNLDLTGTGVRGPGLAALRAALHLGVLQLDNPALTDADLAQLNVPALHQLQIGSCDLVTRSGRDALHQRLHHCRLYTAQTEQAPTLNGPPYQEAMKSLVGKGYKLKVTGENDGPGNARIVKTESDPWPTSGVITVRSLDCPATAAAADWPLLAQLRDLEMLNYWAGAKGMAGALAQLKTLENLAQVDFSREMAREDDIRALVNFPKLRTVMLCAPSDASLATIASLPHLDFLLLNWDSKVTDSGLAPLEKCASLSKLEIFDRVPISRAAAQRFADLRPDVEVTWQGEELHPTPSGGSTASSQPPLDLAALFADGQSAAPWRTNGAKNDWVVEQGELKFVADGKPGLVKFPTAKLRDANYRLELEFTRTSGTNGFNLDLPLSAGLLSLNLDEGERRRTGLGKSTQYTETFRMEANRRYRLAVTLSGQNRQDSVRVEVDDQPLLTWQGDRQSIAAPMRGGGAENTKWPGLWIPAGDSSFVFHRLQVTLTP